MRGNTVQKWYLPALLTIVLCLTLLALLFERYIQLPDRVLQNLSWFMAV